MTTQVELHLPSLLKLVDDEDVDVRDAVLAEFAQVEALETRLRELPEPPEEEQIQAVLRQVREYQRRGTSKKEVEAASHKAFEPGTVVRHKRYGYRGVVVSADETCQATQQWYEANRTQPDRDQPWYHVLVHGSKQATYAADSSLEADPDPEEVDHPLTEYFFDGFEEGRYIRNERPWPHGW